MGAQNLDEIMDNFGLSKLKRVVYTEKKGNTVRMIRLLGVLSKSLLRNFTNGLYRRVNVVILNIFLRKILVSI